MTGRAIIPAATLMHIVIAMTGDTLRFRFGKILFYVAGYAGDVSMTTQQGKVGFGLMLELDNVPASGCMTAGTIFAKTAFMHIVLEMAGNTLRRRVAEQSVWLMTVVTFSFAVLVEQCEVGEIMIEAVPIKNNDAPFAPYVLRVTGGTFNAARFRMLAMKAGCPGLIGTHLLMAIDAQAVLAVARECDMTGRALRFEFGMALNHLIGHYQCLDINGDRATHT